MLSSPSRKKALIFSRSHYVCSWKANCFTILWKFKISEEFPVPSWDGNPKPQRFSWLNNLKGKQMEGLISRRLIWYKSNLKLYVQSLAIYFVNGWHFLKKESISLLQKVSVACLILILKTPCSRSTNYSETHMQLKSFYRKSPPKF